MFDQNPTTPTAQAVSELVSAEGFDQVLLAEMKLRVLGAIPAK